MYSCQNKIKSICVLGIGMFLGCSNMLFGYDLGEEIYNSFKTVYDKGISVDYLESAYNSEYPADPYLDALNNLDGMQKQVKVAGAQYIEDDLKARNCNLSKKQIWGILYYFVPEFRAEIASSLKKEGGHQASKKKSLDESTIEKYCKKYYLCVQKEEEEYDQVALGIRKYRITASTPKDTMTKCKEYFSNAYKEGSSNEERVQDVNKSRAGNDKFWNATTDDSPYDIMLDLNNIGVFMYEETTEPITPVFYNLPVFSNSAQSLLNNMNFGVGGGSGGKGGGSAGTSVGGSVGGKGGNTAGTSVGGSAGGKSGNIAGTSVGGSVGGKGGVSIGSLNSLDKSNVQVADGARNPLGNNNGGSQKNEDVADKKGIEEQKSDITLVAGDGLSSESVSDVYDDLVDGLGTTSVVDKGILFYGSLCKDEDVEVEPEGSVAMNYGGKTNDVVSDGGNDLSILSEEEYQEMVDYMLSAVDQYSALPEEIQARIMGFVAALDTVNPEGGYNAPATPDTSDEAVSQIKNCVGSCTGLRMDQYLSCVEMCACGERTSKVFDPEGNSGMGPIAKIKFCTVPGMDMSFNEGGRNIISIEEGGKEILGVVDKLSREGKLGIWTKQTNFLDSSTKKMKIGKIISFSISVEGVDLGNKSSESSKQYEENVLERENKSLQNFYEISNSLNDPSHKNKFRMVGYAGENIKDYKGKIDAFSTGTDVNFYGSLVGEAQVDRYISTSEDLSSFLETQARYWVAMKEFMDYMIEYADNLFAKKK